jgi:hypothetical protein
MNPFIARRPTVFEREGDRLLVDDAGIDLDRLEAARAEAKLAFSEIFGDALSSDIERNIAIVVSDEDRTALFEVAILLFEVPLVVDKAVA